MATRPFWVCLIAVAGSGLGAASASGPPCSQADVGTRPDDETRTVRELAAVHAIDFVQGALGKLASERAQDASIRSYGLQVVADQQRLDGTLSKMAQDDGVDVPAVDEQASSARQGHPGREALEAAPPHDVDSKILDIARSEEESGIEVLTDLMAEECRETHRAFLGEAMSVLEHELVDAQKLAKKTKKGSQPVTPSGPQP